MGTLDQISAWGLFPLWEHHQTCMAWAIKHFYGILVIIRFSLRRCSWDWSWPSAKTSKFAYLKRQCIDSFETFDGQWPYGAFTQRKETHAFKQVLTSGGSRGWSVESHLTIRVRGKVASGGCRKPLVVSIESIVFCKKDKYLKRRCVSSQVPVIVIVILVVVWPTCQWLSEALTVDVMVVN